MALKCEKCNILYQEGDFCEKCNGPLSKTDDVVDALGLLSQVDKYEENTVKDLEDESAEPAVVDYWSKTVALPDENEALLALDEEAVVIGNTVTKHVNSDIGEKPDKKSNWKKIGLLVGLLLIVAVGGLFASRVFNNNNDATEVASKTTAVLESETVSTEPATTEPVTTTVSNETLKAELHDKLTSEMAVIDESIKKIHTDKGLPTYTVASNGKLYSVAMQKYLSLEDLNVKDINADELYAVDNSICLGKELAGEFHYATYNAEAGFSELMKISDKQSFLQKMNYKDLPLGEVALLAEGDADRQQINDLIIGDKADVAAVYFRYLSSDGKNAFAIWSPQNNYQSIQYSYLQKTDEGAWQKKYHYEGDIDLNVMIKDIVSIDNHNLAVIPAVNPADFSVQIYDQSELDQISDYFIAKNIVAKNEKLNFFSRINDNAYLEFSGKTRLIILFRPDSKIAYDEIIELDSNQPNRYYYNKIKGLSEYANYYPIHLFTQE